MIFLEANPDLKTEFEDFEMLMLSPDPEVIFEQKDSLKKGNLVAVHPIHGGNYAEYLVASVEKLLSPAEEDVLSKFIALNPGIEKELVLYRLTVLKPDTSVVFESPSSLKKEVNPPVIPFRLSKPLLTLIGVAASLAILFVLYLNLEPLPDQPQLAQDRPHTEKSTTGPAEVTAAVTKESHVSGNDARQAIVPRQRHHSGHDKAIEGRQASSHEAVQPLISSTDLAEAPVLHPESIAIQPNTRAGINRTPRNEFSQLYTYYMIRNQMEYAQNLEEQHARSLIVRSFNAVRQGIFGEDEYNPNAGDEKNLGWAMADLGVKGFNALTSSDLRLIRRMNPEGRTQSYAIRSDRAEYSRSVDK
jgi:hypothetical protein